jgi:AhpD family alkylhydroperoxidase
MTLTHPASALRLAAIDRPRSLLVRLFNWLTRRRLGKVMMPSRVIYARFPGLLWRMLPMYHLLERGLSLEPELVQLIQVHVSALNGCSFCTDIHRASALQQHRSTPAKLTAAATAEPAGDAYSERERAALRYVCEAVQHGAVQDSTFAALRSCFSEREIVELTFLQAFTTYLNRLAVPLGIGSDNFCALPAASGQGG